MSALDDIFLGFDEVFEACQEQTILRARAELAQLRAERDILSDRAKSLEEEALIVMAHKDKIIANLQTKIAEQARQLEAAREIIVISGVWMCSNCFAARKFRSVISGRVI